MSFLLLPFLKDKEHRSRDTEKANDVVPLQFLLEVDNRENTEDDQSDDFLYGLELCGRELGVTDTIGRNLEAIFGKGDQPTDKNYFPERGFLKLEVTVPCGGHKEIGDG